MKTAHTQNSVQAPMLSPKELFELLREKICHEDSWVQQRVSWLLAANGFLFAGYAVLLRVAAECARGSGTVDAQTIVVYFPFFGVILCVLVTFGILGAFLAMRDTKKQWKKLAPQVREHFPSLDSRGLAIIFGRCSAIGLCVGMALLWGFLLWL